ncbi:MAG TPA: hypothetical protein VF652_06730 [Allosphingosinicella sp.]|jgi:hypothetical protein
MPNVNKLPALDLEVGASGASKHAPTAVGALLLDKIGVVIAILA